ncbi:alpha/beta fold hydrolase [Streptomyces rishiriensis]|uniref:alpha/beta fold hydrolase n=1 Tax=Streptomyces rishiriensis TaxID=68264 RepID=UPI0033D33DB2
MGRESARDSVAQTIRESIAYETGLPIKELHDDEPLSSYGIESLMRVAIVRRLERTFGPLSKTLLFEFDTIHELATHLMEHGASECRPEPPTPQAGAAADVEHVALPSNGPMPGSLRRDKDDLAIIGISGRFPLARDLEEFWENLCQGRDCITEIPPRLWDWTEFWDPAKGTTGKSYSKWGGFIEDSDCFDPLFFNISHLEAEAMDPQERVFLEEVHHTLEDAGYTRQALREERVGLYVSAMWGGYQHYGPMDASTNSSFASIANRASYFFDFRGPSIALDTTCSGSLTTLHLACESLARGECDLAIAGGVNITSHPHKYLTLSRTGFASTDGRCRSFGVGGDGYVPGDGVGAVLLKPLSRAVADNDRIHAVIKGSAINHGGRSSGYTVPNVEAQTTLVGMALEKAGIDPRTVTYVEAHAPGTPLGDPIEVRGLTRAFQEHTNDVGFCSIGSVKSNIGHLESAAGFASLAKVVLQMRHRQLVPSLHAEQLNPEIDFDVTPFRVQRELTAWNVPEADPGHGPIPLRAGVSSFGAGGSNAHVIVEEWVPPTAAPRTPDAEQLIVVSAKTEDRLRASVQSLLTHTTQRLIAAPSEPAQAPNASATDRVLARISQAAGIRTMLLDEEDRLDDVIADPASLQTFLGETRSEHGIPADTSLPSSATIAELIGTVSRRTAPLVQLAAAPDLVVLERLAYTLQLGREAMQHRVAVLSSSLSDLAEKLHRLLAEEIDADWCWTGTVKSPAAGIATSTEEESHLARLVSARQRHRLGRLWCTGAPVPWEGLYGTPKPERIALPPYPFARERCWVDDRSTTTNQDPETVTRRADRRPSQPDRPAEAPDLTGLVFRREWLPQTACATERSSDGSSVVVYPTAAAPMAAAVRTILRGERTYGIVLDKQTRLRSGDDWEVEVFDETGIADCLTHVANLETVYFLGGVSTPDYEPTAMAPFDRLQEQSVVSLSRLVKALTAERFAAPRPVRLKVVTNNACTVVPDDRIQPYTSAVQGFARAAAREYPQLEVDIIDVDVVDETAASSLELHTALRHIIDGIAGHHEFAVRAGQLYTPEVRPFALGNVAPSDLVRPNGQYVMIGGAGAVGARLSRYLAERAPIQVVWIGRRAKNAEIQSAIDEVEQLGSQVTYLAADAAEPDQLAQAFQSIEREHGAIDGVFHLAMVHDVTRIEELSDSALRAVLTAKARSTYALRSVLRGRDPGFVAIFSSAESHVGNVGWAGYAAACSFQDSFAQYWGQHASRPVLTVDWGYWEGAPPEADRLLAAKGIRPLSVAQGVAVLEQALACGVVQLTALNVEKHVLELMGITADVAPEQSPSTQAIQPMRRTDETSATQVTHTTQAAEGTDRTQLTPGTPPSTGLRTVLPIATPISEEPQQAVTGLSDRSHSEPTHAAVSEAVLELLSTVLHIDADRLDIDEDLVNYGVDSLMVFALQKTLEKRAGAVPATLFLTCHTISEVARRLLQQHPTAAWALVGKQAPSAVPDPGPAPDSVPGNDAAESAHDPHGGDVARNFGAESLAPSGSDESTRHVGHDAPPISTDYLKQYGKRYRSGELQQWAQSAARPFTPGAPRGRSLTHALVETPGCEQVELFAAGHGVPVLLLPAVGLTAPTWYRQFDSELPDEHHLVLAHPPGYGLSKPITDCTTQGVAGVLADVIDVVSPTGPVHLVASCLGCASAIYLARFLPERVASLTLVGAFHSSSEMLSEGPDQLTTDELAQLLQSGVDRISTDFAAVAFPSDHGPRDRSAIVHYSQRLLLDSLCANSLIALRYLSEMLTLSLLDWLPGIGLPTQLVYGTNDQIVAPRQSAAIAERIPGARLVPIEGAAHFPYLTHSEEFNQLVSRFIASHSTEAVQ